MELSFWLLWCTLISYYHIASLYTWEIPSSFLYMSHKYQSKHMLFRYSYSSGILLSTPFFWCFYMHRNMWFDCFVLGDLFGVRWSAYNFFYFGKRVFGRMNRSSVSILLRNGNLLDLFESNSSNDNNKNTFSVQSHTHFKSNKILFQTCMCAALSGHSVLKKCVALSSIFSVLCIPYWKRGRLLLITTTI